MTPRHTWTFSDGQVIETDRYGVVGRKPSSDKLTDQLDRSHDVTLVTVADEAKSISRVHFTFGSFWARISSS